MSKTITDFFFNSDPDSISNCGKATLPKTAADTTSPYRFGFLDKQTLSPEGLFEVFGESSSTTKPSAPKPIIEPEEKKLLCDIGFALRRKHEIDVFSGISLESGDEWAAEVVNETGLGLTALGNSNKLITDSSYPLHIGLDPARAFDRALLARLGGWIYAGKERQREAFLYPHDTLTKLYFRLNTKKSTGNGSFYIRIRVWGHRPDISQDTVHEVTGMTFMRPLLPNGKLGKHKVIVRLCGGPGNGKWHIGVEEAAYLIEEQGYEFYVPGPPKRKLVVVHREECTYLRAVGDKIGGNELMSLTCSHPFP
jgi:hypothetical protein